MKIPSAGQTQFVLLKKEVLYKFFIEAKYILINSELPIKCHLDSISKFSRKTFFGSLQIFPN